MFVRLAFKILLSDQLKSRHYSLMCSLISQNIVAKADALMFSPESVVLMYCLTCRATVAWKNSTQASSPLNPNEQTAGSIHLWSVPISAY